MTSREAELVTACVADPDDAAPRLVWADAIGGERGELVVIQCELERAELPRARRVALWRRERELLAANVRAWSELDGIATRARFRRGFVAAIEITESALLANGPAIRERAPLLREITVTDVTVDGVRAIAELARALALDGVDLVNLVDFHTGDDDAAWRHHVAMLAALPLRALGLPTPPPVVLASDTLESLRARGVFDSAALARLPRLAALAAPIDWGETDVAPLARMRSLVVAYIPGNDLSRLVAAAPRLEELVLENRNYPHPGAAALARLPGLRALDVSRSYALATHIEAAAFAAASWPALRVLRLGPMLERADLRTIASALGPQLDVLDLRRARPLDLGDVAACSGDVLIDEPEEAELVSRAPAGWRTAVADRPTGEPMWLVEIGGPHAGAVHELRAAGPVTIGRSYVADVQTHDGSIARRHARVELVGGELVVQDLGSTNGTIVDGVRAHRTIARDGAELRVGARVLRVFHGDGGGRRARELARTLGQI